MPPIGSRCVCVVDSILTFDWARLQNEYSRFEEQAGGGAQHGRASAKRLTCV